MNEIPKFAAPQTVTTGPIVGSRKVYASPSGRADIRVPFREITLSDPNQAPVRVYDPSGPYTQSHTRSIWPRDSSQCARPGSKRASRRNAATPDQPEDNGNVSADRLAPLCPAERTLRGGSPTSLSPSSIRPSRILTEEMIYVAVARISAREVAVERAQSVWAMASFGAEFRVHHDRNLCARSGAGRASRPCQHQSPRTRTDGDRP